METREPAPFGELPVPGMFDAAAAPGHARTALELSDAQLRHGTYTDGRVMLGLARTDSVLVLGAGAGQVARQLAPWVRVVHCVADARGQALAADSFDWVIIDGLIPGHGGFAANIEPLLPALKPGGRVLARFDNRLGLGRRSPGRRDGAALGCRGLRHALQLAALPGLTPLACYALLPNPMAARTWIPLEPPCTRPAEKFALDQAWKRSSAARALGRRALHVLVDLRVMRQLYPHYVVVGRKAC